MDPRSILEELKAIETELGRPSIEAREKHAARVIDADLLCAFSVDPDRRRERLFETITVDDGDNLQIPHPMAFKRDFVAIPLLELVFNEVYAFPEAVRSYFKREFEKNEKYYHENRTILGPLSTVYAAHEPRGVIRLGGGGATGAVGIVNATPDSFSNDGLLSSADFVNAGVTAIRRGIREWGALAMDLGGESTRPGAEIVPIEEEWDRRLLPILTGLASEPNSASNLISRISVDTTKVEVAKRAIAQGVTVINDTSCGRGGILNVISGTPEACAIIQHSRGTSATMNRLHITREEEEDEYRRSKADAAKKVRFTMDRNFRAKFESDDDDENDENDTRRRMLVRIVAREIKESLAKFPEIPPWRLCLDPGLGFAKTDDQSHLLLDSASLMKREAGWHGIGVMIGASRKRFLRRLFEKHNTNMSTAWSREVADDLTLASSVSASVNGADFVRVHDVARNVRGLFVVTPERG